MLYLKEPEMELNFPHNSSKGISLSSFFEHKYSPNTTIRIIPMMCIIHQSQVDGNPPYIEHKMMCIIKSVTEKSRHFFDFSTINANIIALFTKQKNKAITLDSS